MYVIVHADCFAPLIGKVLQDYLQSCPESYSRVVYVGDGRNDLCPVLGLTERDVAVVRKDYSLDGLLSEESLQFSASVHVVDFTKELEDCIIRKCL